MGALIGLPPSLVEIYSSDIKKVYKANSVPLYLGLALTNISAYIHLSIMSIILYIAAPLIFNAEIPENPSMYFISLAIFTTVSFSIASIIGLAVKDQAKTSMFSIIVFLPSIMLSGIMFPIELLPKVFETIGKYEYKLIIAISFLLYVLAFIIEKKILVISMNELLSLFINALMLLLRSQFSFVIGGIFASKTIINQNIEKILSNNIIA